MRCRQDSTLQDTPACHISVRVQLGRDLSTPWPGPVRWAKWVAWGCIQASTQARSMDWAPVHLIMNEQPGVVAPSASDHEQVGNTLSLKHQEPRGATLDLGSSGARAMEGSQACTPTIKVVSRCQGQLRDQLPRCPSSGGGSPAPSRSPLRKHLGQCQASAFAHHTWRLTVGEAQCGACAGGVVFTQQAHVGPSPPPCPDRCVRGALHFCTERLDYISKSSSGLVKSLQMVVSACEF